MWFWLITLLKGFLPIDGKRIGKIIWVLVLSAIAIGIYHKIFIAKTTHQNITTQIINQCEDTKIVGLRFNIWRLRLLLGF
jgi:hypothetical protein